MRLCALVVDVCFEQVPCKSRLPEVKPEVGHGYGARLCVTWSMAWAILSTWKSASRTFCSEFLAVWFWFLTIQWGGIGRFKNCLGHCHWKELRNNEEPLKPRIDTISRSLKNWRWICLWRHNSYQSRVSCDVTSDFNLDFLAIGWSNRCAVWSFFFNLFFLSNTSMSFCVITGAVWLFI